MKKYLEELATQSTLQDDIDNFNPYESCGGNCDDCYYLGVEDGEIHLARHLLEKFFKEENK